MRKEEVKMNLVKLTENDKRLIIVLLLVVILLFVIIGYLSLFVKKIMDKQGSKSDEMLSNVVKAEYFDSEKKLIKFGIRKNARVFFKEARIPFLILCVAWFGFLLYCLFSGNWHYNPLSKEDGFGTLVFQLGEWPKEKFFGIKLISGWPDVVAKPHWVWKAWFSYLFVPLNLVGGVWFLICTQAYIARSLRIYKIAHGIFRKKLVAESAPTSSNPENIAQ